MSIDVFFCHSDWIWLFPVARELAIQIAEQFEALGSDISLRCAVVSSWF